MRQLVLRFWPRGSPTPSAAGRPTDLSRATNLYLLLVSLAALAAALPAFAHLHPRTRDWLVLIVLGTSAAVSSLFVVPTGRSHGFHLALLFIAAAIFLLPPGFVALVPVIQHVPDWVRRRYAWYIRLFNVSNYTFDALAGWLAGHVVPPSPVPAAHLLLPLRRPAPPLTFVLL